MIYIYNVCNYERKKKVYKEMKFRFSFLKIILLYQKNKIYYRVIYKKKRENKCFKKK